MPAAPASPVATDLPAPTTKRKSLIDSADEAQQIVLRKLDAALPDERASFYAEARALALAPGISPVVRTLIESRCAE